ncbi:hypothetical protein GF373_17680 [bacterium]|nr:hypothetical protein [bacterium]
MKILVVGCDAYAKLAPRFMEHFHKAWKSCPYDVEFVADSQELDVDVPVIYTHRGTLDYGGKLHDYLVQCSDDLVLILMIDFVLAYVDEDTVAQAEKIAQKSSVGRVQLSRPGNSLCGGAVYENDDHFRIIPCEDKYALSTHVGIWERDLLLRFVKPGENPGQTEITGTARMQQGKCGGKTLLASHLPAIYVVNTHRFGVERFEGEVLDTCIQGVYSLAKEHRELG